MGGIVPGLLPVNHGRSLVENRPLILLQHRFGTVEAMSRSTKGLSDKVGEWHMRQLMLALAAWFAVVTSAAVGQEKSSQIADACRATGLLALQQRSSEVTDLLLDMESLAVSEAETQVEDVAIRTVVLGEAYIRRGKEEPTKPNRFVCLIGEKGKVLLTFFTSK
jgi:hypothetical protein